MTWIAELQVIWVLASSERRPGRIAIGMPVVVSDIEASCAYALDGLEYVAGPVHGAHTMQALCTALSFVGWKLHAFLAGGGRVLHDTGDDVALEDVFGPLLTEPVAAEPTDDDA
jgi:hypothetical protein